MHPVQLVIAVRGEDQRAHRLDAPRDDAQYVQGGGIGPLQIFEDDHDRDAFAELVQELRSKFVRPGLSAGEPFELASNDAGNVDERAEWPRRRQRVASAPDHSRAGWEP